VPISHLNPALSLAALVVGLVCVILGTVTVIRDRRRRAEWPRYPGRVVTSRLDDGKIRFQVSYVRDGRQITFWNRFTAPVDPMGQDVQVLVNPENPDDALVSRGLIGGSSLGLGVIGFGVFVLVLVSL
jgi:hypothetical protein